MKKLWFVMFAFILAVSFVSAALPDVSLVKNKTLSTKNGICEYFTQEFKVGQKDVWTVNGQVLNIEYLGNKEWLINGYRGELKNHDFFMNNPLLSLKGVRFDFGFMSQDQPEGNLGLTEIDYYPFDCLGYLPSHGLTKELIVKPGWNLLPAGTSVRECIYAREDELCSDDVLVMYYYFPTLKKYFTEKQLVNMQDSPAFKSYFNEENEDTIHQSSYWIYVKKSGANKRLSRDFGAADSLRNSILGNNVIKMTSGWNFMFVDAFMVYDDRWNLDPLTMNDMKGDCNIEKYYLWDNQNKKWYKDSKGNDAYFDAIAIGWAMIVKVDKDCTLGEPTDLESPPSLPTDSTVSDIIVAKNIDVSGDIKDIIYLSSQKIEDNCPFDLKGNCDIYNAKYSYNGEIDAYVVPLTLSINDFINKSESTYVNSTKGDFIGNDYYIYISGDTLLVYWYSKNKLVMVKIDTFDVAKEEDYMEDLLNVYLTKYPSDLHWN